MSRGKRGIRGRILSFLADPAQHGAAAAVRYVADGLVVVEDGIIRAVGEAAPLLASLPDGTEIDQHRDRLILPGFIDPHIHLPQTRIVGAYAAELLEWLNRYTFVEEQKFANSQYAEAGAQFFIDELVRNGTTTAAVYCTTHPDAVEIFFAESARRNMRMLAGKVMMDRNAPAGLLDTAERGYRESRALLERWHGRGRQLYAITPRFALTSTEAQLEAVGALAREYPSVHVQTHLDENRAEIASVRALFPWAESYAAVYDRYGLLGPRTLLGHCIHLEESERVLLRARQARAIFCPTSNLFLGSGLFDRDRLVAAGIEVGIATDIGGGTSYSMLRTAAEGYKVLQLQGQRWPAYEMFYALTRGNAAVLGLEDKIGTIAAGMEADMVVLDARATPALAHRMTAVGELAEELFLLLTCGDDRVVAETYVAGVPQKSVTGRHSALPGRA